MPLNYKIIFERMIPLPIQWSQFETLTHNWNHFLHS